MNRVLIPEEPVHYLPTLAQRIGLAESILAHFALDEFFTTVVGSRLDGSRTGKADILADALAQLDRPAVGAVMVGDRRHDVAGARAVGMPCLGALWGYGTAEELSESGADVLVGTPRDLVPLLLG